MGAQPTSIHVYQYLMHARELLANALEFLGEDCVSYLKTRELLVSSIAIFLR